METQFPNYERIADGEGVVLRKGNEVIRVLPKRFGLDTIQRYAQLTSSLASHINGQSIKIPIPDEENRSLTVFINSMSAHGPLSDGSVYTKSPYIEGWNLTSMYEVRHILGTRGWLMKALNTNDDAVLFIIKDCLTELLRGVALPHEQAAIAIDPDNLKPLPFEDPTKIMITDISCHISTLIKRT